MGRPIGDVLNGNKKEKYKQPYEFLQDELPEKKILANEPKEMRVMSEGHDVDKFYPPDEGKKFDSGKLRWDLLMWDVLQDLAKVITYGAEKYTPNNWQKNPMWKYKAAYMRHYVAWLLGEENDQESGLHHLAHAMCNLMFLHWQDKNRVRTYPKKGD